MIFKRVIIAFFITFASIMLFIFIIRLANGKTGFFGLSDLFAHFETIDFKAPLNAFINDISTIANGWKQLAGEFSRGWTASIDVVNFFSTIGRTLILPFTIIYDICYFIYGYIQIFWNFLNYVISFDGYSSII